MTRPEETDLPPTDHGSGEPDPPPAPLLELRDPPRSVVAADADLQRAAEAIAAGEGPIAIDAERASGYRYSGRAYLLQLRREGAGTYLIDPLPMTTLSPLADALAGAEWIIHAATQDLPCLTELGLRPTRLFDTELAGRLLGYPRVGLATLVEEILGFRMRKEHSAADWSTRPLPEPWLEYAALDVEVLVELRDALAEELVASGKWGYAEQEFEMLLSFEPAVRVDAWRRTSGMHRVRSRRALAAVRELWTRRDEIARQRDVTPGRIIPDSAIVAAATSTATSVEQLLGTRGFHGRGARRYGNEWLRALRTARELPEDELPTATAGSLGPPPPRAWADRDPAAARRLALSREALTKLAEGLGMPVENLLTPDYLRRLLWEPPATRAAEPLAEEVGVRLREAGARAWQIELTTPALVAAIIAGDDPASVSDPVAEPVSEPVSDPVSQPK